LAGPDEPCLDVIKALRFRRELHTSGAPDRAFLSVAEFDEPTVYDSMRHFSDMIREGIFRKLTVNGTSK
jgi:hypothetical protein